MKITDHIYVGDYRPTSRDMDRDDAYDNGITAFDKGLKIETNPHDITTEKDLHLAWADGFMVENA